MDKSARRVVFLSAWQQPSLALRRASRLGVGALGRRAVAAVVVDDASSCDVVRGLDARGQARRSPRWPAKQRHGVNATQQPLAVAWVRERTRRLGATQPNGMPACTQAYDKYGTCTRCTCYALTLQCRGSCGGGAACTSGRGGGGRARSIPRSGRRPRSCCPNDDNDRRHARGTHEGANHT